MTSKRRGLIIGGVLAGSLLLGSAGLVAAQDPTASPSPSATWSGAAGMMGGAGAAGMMGGADMKAMAGLHQSMATNGTCDPARMRALHPQVRTNR
ncbi:MAG TPA: hypothetical protein VNF73_06900 [Candidatus Saccharimonadales bacterium]|nr:hypothetical protein [Candidatus Saccharimonadales bacterium]